MFAQLSLLREAWEDIIDVLDGFVGVDRPSEPLAWLAHAFANAPTQARTSPFYRKHPAGDAGIFRRRWYCGPAGGLSS
ncbi:hypothetical protein LHT11_14870, partial [Acetobacter indonesiensis]|nr:hypothetical protein [Acetobacter indonesiensis]